jgi:hypothetical protein
MAMALKEVWQEQLQPTTTFPTPKTFFFTQHLHGPVNLHGVV